MLGSSIHMDNRTMEDLDITMYYELGSHPTPVQDTGFKCIYVYVETKWFSLRLLVRLF